MLSLLVDPATREDRENDWQDSYTPDEHFAANKLHRAGRHFAMSDESRDQGLEHDVCAQATR